MPRTARDVVFVDGVRRGDGRRRGGRARPDLTLDPEVVAALAGGDRPPTEDQVRQRALEGLAEEIRLMLAEGVVAAPEDIDLCMIMGAGWPFHLGGITPHLDRTGIAEKVTGGDEARAVRRFRHTMSAGFASGSARKSSLGRFRQGKRIFVYTNPA